MSLKEELAFSKCTLFPGMILAYAGLPSPLYSRLFSGLNTQPLL